MVKVILDKGKKGQAEWEYHGPAQLPRAKQRARALTLLHASPEPDETKEGETVIFRVDASIFYGG